MPCERNEESNVDLTISHGFLNTIHACYQGIYVYQTVLEAMTPTPADAMRLEQTARVLEVVGEWWARFEQLDPIVRRSQGDRLSGAAEQAWQYMEEARRHLDTVSVDLLDTMDAGKVGLDRGARALRLAAFCERAYGREHYVRGLIKYGEIMDRPEVADRWRKHTLPATEGRAHATGYFEHMSALEPHVGEDEIERLLDLTLTLPLALGRQSIDILKLFGMYRGHFSHSDAGIPRGEIQPWFEGGFTPYEAAQWRRVGMRPEQAVTWIRAGVPDALMAAEFAWRDIPVEQAAAWWAAGYEGRAAAGWLREGIESPEQIPRVANQ
jgi:hypothetical protein